jgi:hypothetical protein
MGLVNIRFTQSYYTRQAAYMAGERAAFDEQEARHIVDRGCGEVIRQQAVEAPPVDKMVKRAPRKKRQKPSWNAPPAS